ncbi:MAG: hypothetical protein WCH86_08635 [Kiritimatiellales bacterium]
MKTELEIIEAFYQRVCERAEANMLKTGKLEGAHFAAMQTEIAALKQKAATAEG